MYCIRICQSLIIISLTFEIVIMPSCNRLSYSNEQKLFWVKLFKESHFSGKDAKLRFLNHVHCEARLKAGEFYDQFKKKKGYKIPPIDTFRRWKSRLKLNVIISFASYFLVIIWTYIYTYTYVLLCEVLTSFLHSYKTRNSPKSGLVITRYCWI